MKEITLQEFEKMGDALYAIQKRAMRGRTYGEDMKTSRAQVLIDIITVANWALHQNEAEAVLKEAK